MPGVRRPRARPLVPRAAVRARPTQHIEIPALRRVVARKLVPLAPVRARPLQHIEVPPRCRERARPVVPRKSVRARPPQHVELPALRRVQTHDLYAKTTSVVQFLQRALASTATHHKMRLRVPCVRGKVFHLTSRARHRVAHGTTHRSKPGKIFHVRQVHETDNVGDDDVEGKTWNGILRVWM